MLVLVQSLRIPSVVRLNPGSDKFLELLRSLDQLLGLCFSHSRLRMLDDEHRCSGPEGADRSGCDAVL